MNVSLLAEGGNALVDWHASVYGSRTGGESRYGAGFGARHDGFAKDDGDVLYGRQAVISDYTLRRLAGSSYIRARQVLSGGRMHDFACTAGEGDHADDLVLSARVQAADRFAEDYEVGVNVNPQADELSDSHCTCPAFGRYGRVCKHVIALVMAYNQKPEDFTVSGVGPRRAQGATTTRMLREYMRQRDTQQRIEAKQRRLDLLKDIDRRSQDTDDAPQTGAAGTASNRRMPAGSVSLHLGLGHEAEGWNVFLRIAVPRQSVSYAIKDIAAFAHAVRLQEFVGYGKHLAFVHTRDAFDPLSRRVLDVLERAVSIRDSVLVGQRIGLRREYARDSMTLSEEETAELLTVYTESDRTVEYRPRGPWSIDVAQVPVVDGDPDLAIAIEPRSDAEGGGYVIRHRAGIVDFVSGRAGSFVIVRTAEPEDDGHEAGHGSGREHHEADEGMAIHRCSAGFYRHRRLAQMLCGGAEEGELVLAQDDVESFCSTILPSLTPRGSADGSVHDDATTPDAAAAQVMTHAAGRATGPDAASAPDGHPQASSRRLPVKIPAALLARTKEPCRIAIYLDRDRADDGITCDPQARYGDRSFHVFDGIAPDGVTDGVVRDKDAERLAVEAIREYFPMPTGDVAVIPESDDKAIYRLLTEGLKVLRTLGEVYATPAFDGLSVASHTTVRIGLTMRSGLVEISPIADEIDPSEVPELLASYRKRRRFHRLHDGTFVDTRDIDVSALDEVGADLGIKVATLEDGPVQVPAYEAFYLVHQAKEGDTSPEFDAYLNGLRRIDPGSYRVPDELAGVLRPYQADGFRWLSTVSDQGFGGILADEMGLGKTVQMLSLLVDRRDRSRRYGPDLIVCPASLVYNWTAECSKFCPDLDVVPVAGGKASRRDALRRAKDAYAPCRAQDGRADAVCARDAPDVLVTSYDLLRRDIEDYRGLDCFCMVLDEAQYIKNHATQSSRAARSVSALHRFALTGTPIENRLSELWSIFDFLMPGMLGSYTHFRKRFELPILSGDADAQRKLQAFVRPFILRRLKADVVKDLPDKIENVITVQLEGEQRRLYAALEQRLRASLLKQHDMDFTTGKIQVLAQLTRLRQVCCDPRLLYANADGATTGTDVPGGAAARGRMPSAKLDAIEELVSTCQDAGRKMLIFSQFTSYLDLIAQRLRRDEVQYDVITGATPKRRRVELVDQFNRDDTPVFLISLKAGNTGLNLTGACVVVHADPWWNAAAQEQATDRAHRIGQTQDVNVYQVVAKDTIEERIVSLQHEKSDLASRFVDSSASTNGASISRLTRDDLLALLG
ncbi:SNF2-related protein [Bifidobacterium mongoliense]|uniref:SNF2-related protein n=1 Tax=Bifidobacterium mongoliense TaxID=518643 RepID=UPI0030F41704